MQHGWLTTNRFIRAMILFFCCLRNELFSTSILHMSSWLFIIAMQISLCWQINAQNSNVVHPVPPRETDSIPIGQIIFSDRMPGSSSLSQHKQVPVYPFTHKSDLFILAKFDQPLSAYLQELAPGLSGDSIFRQGNFQFSLYVDQRLIYQSNLLPGAPTRALQDTALLLNRALINNVSGTGSWSESFWNRFMSNGGDSALTDGPHQLKMEIRPYIRMKEDIKTGSLMASGEVKLEVKRNIKPDISNIKVSKPLPYNGLLPSKDKFDDRKIKELKAKIEEGVFKQVSGIIVLSHGKLLIEEYFNGATRQTLHDPRSVGKSFASTLLGMAIDDGFIKNEDQTLKEYYDVTSFANYNKLKEKVTLKELLTMSSSFDGNDENDLSPGNEENMYPTADWVKFAMDLPNKETTPPGQWHYFTAGVILLGDVINKKVPAGLESYASKRLFRPLGIHHYQWQYTPQKLPNTAGGIRMNALDFAKYGQLYKNKGNWAGQQLLSREWVKKSLSKHKAITGRKDEYYGYLFWNKTFRIGTKSYEAFYCAGNGGNYILVFQDLPYVIVITATAYGRSYAHSQATLMLTDYILPALVQ
jgi:CubicO group peptidase (beta-lactamase class C family)